MSGMHFVPEALALQQGPHTTKRRVAEIFGPTIQGEGRLVGMPCHFVRFGGCDFRCKWCDTPHAVLPELVSKLPQMDEEEIYHKVLALGKGGQHIRWVVLTGGNPALFNLDLLIDLLHKGGYKVMLETQGTLFKEWFGKVDDICFSPKPPSAGNMTDLLNLSHIVTNTIHAQMRHWESKGSDSEQWFPLPYLKVPIFTDDDLKYAAEVKRVLGPLEMFLSVGNDDPYLPTVGNPTPPPGGHVVWARDSVLDNFTRVLELVLESYPMLHDCRIFPQQHVLLWGNQRGH